MERVFREGCPSSPVLFNLYHAAVMMDFRARRAQAAEEGLMDAGVPWVSQVDGRLFRPRFQRRKKRFHLHTILGDIEFADDTVTCSATDPAPAVELLFDSLGDWEGKTERFLVVPFAFHREYAV